LVRCWSVVAWQANEQSPDWLLQMLVNSVADGTMQAISQDLKNRKGGTARLSNT